MPIEIHGKPYYTVVERLKMLKADFKLDYSLKTELLKCDDKVVIVKATLSFNGNEYTGLALEIIGSSNINTHSYLMNCETSAIGRALSAANYLGSEYCSANEMESALSKEKHTPKPIPKDINPITGEESDVITFGKHKGKNWKEVDEGWLNWIVENNEKYRDKALSVLDDRKPRQAGGISDSDAFKEHEKAEIEADSAIADQDKIPF